MGILPRDLAKIHCHFEMRVVEDRKATKEKGRPIHKMEPFAHLQQMGGRDYTIIGAHERYQYVREGLSESAWKSAAELFSDDWEEFLKAETEEYEIGTRIEQFPGISRAQAADLRALGVTTVEALANLSDSQADRLGPEGAIMRKNALAYLDDSGSLADHSALEQRIAELEAKLAAATSGPAPVVVDEDDGSQIFESMELEDLRLYLDDIGVDYAQNVGAKALRRKCVEHSRRVNGLAA